MWRLMGFRKNDEQLAIDIDLPNITESDLRALWKDKQRIGDIPLGLNDLRVLERTTKDALDSDTYDFFLGNYAD